jgi:16S rRNA (guanine527-N7)-methyltransferase
VSDQALRDALASSQRLGMLGERPIDEVLDHARAVVRALVDVTGTVVDLGSGGGVPGLVLAVDRPDLSVLLVDRRRTRTDHLQRLVRRLDLGDRVEVRAADAFGLVLPTPCDAVVARGFGPPEVTAAAAAPLVRADGVLVVTEPPGGRDRWAGVPDFVREPWTDARVAVLRRST